MRPVGGVVVAGRRKATRRNLKCTTHTRGIIRTKITTCMRTRRQAPIQTNVELFHEFADLCPGNLPPPHRELSQQRSQYGMLGLHHRQLVELGRIFAVGGVMAHEGWFVLSRSRVSGKGFDRQTACRAIQGLKILHSASAGGPAAQKAGVAKRARSAPNVRL